MKTSLKNILNESIEERLSEDQINEFKETVARYNEFNESIYRDNKALNETLNKIKFVAENAKQVLVQEADDWFDTVTINRHTKNINESYKIFEKTVNEMNILQKRMEMAYEDMGQSLDKYFEIRELNEVPDEEDDVMDEDMEEGNAFGAAVTKAKKAGKKSFKVDGKTYPVKEGREEIVNGSEFKKIKSEFEKARNAGSKKVKQIGRKGWRMLYAYVAKNGEVYSVTEPADDNQPWMIKKVK